MTAVLLNNISKCVVESEGLVWKQRPSHGACTVIGEPQFDCSLLVAVAKSITNRVRHDQFCDRTHEMIRNNVGRLINNVIAGGVGSSGSSNGGGWCHGRKSRCSHGRVKNCDHTFNSGGKKMIVPVGENWRVDCRCRR